MSVHDLQVLLDAWYHGGKCWVAGGALAGMQGRSGLNGNGWEAYVSGNHGGLQHVRLGVPWGPGAVAWKEPEKAPGTAGWKAGGTLVVVAQTVREIERTAQAEPLWMALGVGQMLEVVVQMARGAEWAAVVL